MIRIAGVVAAFALSLPPKGAIERVPVRHYTAADGLGQDLVGRIALDSDGFLWLATVEGLGRFDGERFARFGEAEGLRGPIVNDVAVGPDGTYWAATEAGLFWFRPRDRPDGPLFRQVALEGVPDRDEPFRLLVARSGTVWVGTLKRLWRVDGSPGAWKVTPVEFRPGRSRVQALREDPSGGVWVGTHLHGVFRVRPDGGVDHCPDQTEGAHFVRDFHFPGDGSVWMAFLGGVAIFDRPPFPGRATKIFGRAEGLSIDTQCLLAEDEDTVLLGTTTGITEIVRSADGGWSVGRTLDRRSGLPGDLVSWLLRDPQGNLWAALSLRGVAKIPRGGISSLPEAEEPGTVFVDMKVDREGRVVALASKGGKALAAYSPSGPRPGWFPLSLPRSMTYVGWGGSQKLLPDSRGSWWVATGSGMVRYDDARRTGPRRMELPADARFGPEEGLPGVDAYVVAEDARGDVWMSVQATRPGASSVSRWKRQTGAVENFSAEEVGTSSLAGQFQSTRDGAMWITFVDRRLVRFREGRFQAITMAPGPELGGMFEDREGRLWILGRSPVICDRPGAAEPRFVPKTIGDGYWLRCMLEDHDGQLWFGTNQGVIRFDPATEHLQRVTVDDGLVGNYVGLCAQDGAGTLWFSDQNGLSRLEPRPERALDLAAARLREIRIAGEAIPLPMNGATSTGGITVPTDRRRITVEFFAVHHGPGPAPRFQYRLEGSDPDWSAPATDRSVQYAQLAPGRYRFLVRTVGEDGTTSNAPASVSLRVLAPVWQRPWFLALCAGAAGGLALALHRLRVGRVIASERIRTRIATDLHDDIGSSLSQISILSQLAHRQATDSGARAPETLERITALSGELIDAMSDVVWAISPRWDTESALVHRMRRFASELFADGSAELELALPEGDETAVEPEVRRQLYMVFKEALHNVRRHASARHVAVELRRTPGAGWYLRIEEDGRGFDTGRESAGHGLRSMRRRAERIGGTLEVRSSPQGTRLELTLPEKNLSNR